MRSHSRSRIQKSFFTCITHLFSTNKQKLLLDCKKDQIYFSRGQVFSHFSARTHGFCRCGQIFRDFHAQIIRVSSRPYYCGRGNILSTSFKGRRSTCAICLLELFRRFFIERATSNLSAASKLRMPDSGYQLPTIWKTSSLGN